MTGDLDANEPCERRVRAGFDVLRARVGNDVDTESALRAVVSDDVGSTPGVIEEARSARWGRRTSWIIGTAAAGFIAIVVTMAVWPSPSVRVDASLDPGGRGSVHRSTPSPTSAPAVPAPTEPPSAGRPDTAIAEGDTVAQNALLQNAVANNLDSDSTEPDGSGCTPGGDSLPDGVWYGYISDEGGELGFDLVCRYSKEAAKIAIRVDEGHSADDWEELYRRNRSPRVRALDIDSASTLIDMDDDKYGASPPAVSADGPVWRRITLGELIGHLHEPDRTRSEDGTAAWVWIEDGHVERLEVSWDNYFG